MAGKFFDLFPKIVYDIAGKDVAAFDNVTNIFFRIRVLRKVLANVAAYYEYVVPDGDTPEIVAEKVYGDAEAHWIILLANEMLDAQFDWPLTSQEFNRYLISKYGSLANARNTVHHYEKIIRREESASGLVTETRFEVDAEGLDEGDLDVPYDSYATLAEDGTFETVNMGGGKTVMQVSSREAISVYDWEEARNEAKRHIKIIKPEYYGRIIAEFDELTDFSKAPYIRRLG